MKKEDIISWLVVINAIILLMFIWMFIAGYIFSGKDTILNAGVGLISAIVGGTISGLLTLFGVKQTIKADKEKNSLEEIPIRIQLLTRLDNDFRSLEFQELTLDENVGTVGANIINYLYNKNIYIKSIKSSKKVYEKIEKLREDSLDLIRNFNDINKLDLKQRRRYISDMEIGNITTIIQQEVERLKKIYLKSLL